MLELTFHLFYFCVFCFPVDKRSSDITEGWCDPFSGTFRRSTEEHGGRTGWYHDNLRQID